MKYTVRNGDSLIKIAKAFGLNSLDEIIKANPTPIHVGQVLDLPDPEFYDSLDAAGVTAKRPDYSRTPAYQLPSSTQVIDMSGVHYANPDKEAYTRANEQQVMYGYADKVRAYGQALYDHKMSLNDIPEQYRQQAYNYSIRNAGNTTAPYVAKWVMLAPWTIADAVTRGTLNEARKGVALATGTPREEVENDYGMGDYFSNFSWLGKKFQEEHPVADAVINAVTTPVVMTSGENLAAKAMDGVTLANTVRGAVNSTSAGWGVRTPYAEVAENGALYSTEAGAQVGYTVPQRMKMIAASEKQAANAANVSRQSGSVYRGSGIAKGSGKTGTVTRGSGNRGYSANTSSKGNYSNQSSYVPRTTKQTVVYESPDPTFNGTGYWHGFYTPVSEHRTNYVIATPQEEYIEEVVPDWNRWIYGPETKEKAPYKEGMEHLTYTTAQAPSGKSVKEQPITKESIKKHEGSAKRSATERYGQAEGSTSSGWYSGYGFTYGTGGGPWVRKNGGKVAPKSLVLW